MIHPSYNIKKMKDNYLKVIVDLENSIATEFKKYFSQFYTNDSVPQINNDRGCKTSFHKLTSYSSLDEVYSGAGLYIILSTYNSESNKCSLHFNNDNSTIYRGESAYTKKRIGSHLFNKLYNENYNLRESEAKLKSRSFGEVRYNTCIKIKKNENGININEPPYSRYEWFVIIHKMANSNSLIRKQAEKAFDCLFERPFANREARPLTKTE